MPAYAPDPATTIPALHTLTRHDTEAEALIAYEEARGRQLWIGGSVRPPSAGSTRWNCHSYELNTSGRSGRATMQSAYITIPLSQAASIGIDLREAHEAVLSNCQHDERSAELTDGRRVCCDCWNLSVDIRRAGQKQERDARQRCEVCHKHAAQYDLGAPVQIAVCGRCKSKIDQAHRRRMSNAPSHLAMFATVHYTREQFIKLAQADTSAARGLDLTSGEVLEQERMF